MKTFLLVLAMATTMSFIGCFIFALWQMSKIDELDEE